MPSAANSLLCNHSFFTQRIYEQAVDGNQGFVHSSKAEGV
jgi:uncharacterized protein (DUF952 family)